MPSPQVPRRHHPLLEFLTWGLCLDQGANNQNATRDLWAAQQPRALASCKRSWGSPSQPSH